MTSAGNLAHNDRQLFTLPNVEVVQVDSEGGHAADKLLGGGSSTAVLELEYNGLKCAGKKVHDWLVGSKDIVDRFVEECDFLSKVRHPNIVQFLGFYFQQGVRAPILVMEFLPTNLTSCIEQYGILPNEISYSILHDVALGLCYLHSQTPPIIHRNLYSNNVLLTPNMTAKISDLGKAKILTNTKRQTKNPGNIIFMPPEAMMSKPEYDTCIDEFSYGIMMIHMFSGQWPEPQVGPVRAEPSGRMIPVSEAERRELFLRAIGNDHPLMDLILKCIHSYPESRARASEIVGRLAEMVLQFPASFANRLEMLRQIELLKAEHSTTVPTEETQLITETQLDNSTGQNAATTHEEETAPSSTGTVDNPQDSTEDSLQQLARSISNERKRDSVSSTSSCDSPGYSRQSTLDESEKLILNLKNVQKELHIKVADEWEDIGIQLGIDDGRLNQIKVDNASKSKTCFREMLRTWLNRVDPPPSWSALADALETLGNEVVAAQITSKYCKEISSA